MKTSGFDARAVANEFLSLAESYSIPLSNLHLQKVVFFSHAEFLVKTGLELVVNRFEAWEHGPVIPELYHALKEFDDRPITGRAKKYDFISKSYTDVADDFALSTRTFLEAMLMYYGRMDAWTLVKLSHTPGSPWSVTIERAKHYANFAMIIEPALIRDCFHSLSADMIKH